jgi:hypothetical protein
MRRALLVFAVLIAGYTATARAQNIKLSDVAGTWNIRSTAGPKDTVVQSVVTATPDRKGWVLKFANRDPIPLRVVAVGGDSVVTEAGPYPSVRRPGQTVTLLHSVGHYKGDTMTGTYEGHLSSGEVIKGAQEGTRAK